MGESKRARYERIQRASKSGVATSLDDTRFLLSVIEQLENQVRLDRADVELLVSVLKQRIAKSTVLKRDRVSSTPPPPPLEQEPT